MRFILIALLIIPAAFAQNAVCDGNGSCPAITNDISNSAISTDGNSMRVSKPIYGTIPPRDGAVLYKIISGTMAIVSASTDTYYDPSTKSLVAVNANVLNGLTIPTAASGVTPTLGNVAITATGSICTKNISGTWINQTIQTVTTTLANIGSLIGSGTTVPTACRF